MTLSGCATLAGSERFAQRFPAAARDFFRVVQGLVWSNLGVGTHRGAPDAATDSRYAEAITRSVLGGINVIDTAANYRCMRSERAVGEALRLIADHGVGREEIIVITKGGYIAWDSAPPPDPAVQIEARYLRRGLCGADDVVGARHCLAPNFLHEAVEQSLRNLRLETIDAYLLHNPEEQAMALPREKYRTRVAKAFEALEEEVRRGRINCYGVATWASLRAWPGDAGHCDILELLRIAEEVAGAAHRFGVVQLPFNLAMPEAMLRPNQRSRQADDRRTVLEVCRAEGLAVMASVPLAQSQLAGQRFEALAALFPETASSAQACLQFARSAAGITTAVVGMTNAAHVRQNLELVGVPCRSDMAAPV